MLSHVTSHVTTQKTHVQFPHCIYIFVFISGEEISEATEREVFEETGVRCQFESVLLFRHQHDYKYGCSDFYFVSLCKALTDTISAGFNEIALCTWMDVSILFYRPFLKKKLVKTGTQ